MKSRGQALLPEGPRLRMSRKSRLTFGSSENPDVMKQTNDEDRVLAKRNRGAGEEKLLSIIPRDQKKPYDMRRLPSLVLDRDSIFEIGKYQGRSQFTALARLIMLRGFPSLDQGGEDLELMIHPRGRPLPQGSRADARHLLH